MPLLFIIFKLGSSLNNYSLSGELCLKIPAPRAFPGLQVFYHGLILLKQANPYKDSSWLLISLEIFYWNHKEELKDPI